MRIALGNDHAGFPMKSHVISVLEELGHEVTDLGAQSTDPVDFPDVARLVCDSVRSGDADRGVMVCGTGVGASIAANKVPGIRATVCHDTYSARQSVEHDDVNVLCIGAWIIGPTTAAEIVKQYLQAEFRTEEQFRRRVRKLADMERTAARELADAPEPSDETEGVR
jgi:ribose 5-phosphate isomerase B